MHSNLILRKNIARYLYLTRIINGVIFTLKKYCKFSDLIHDAITDLIHLKMCRLPLGRVFKWLLSSQGSLLVAIRVIHISLLIFDIAS